jgi:hypothetical protein
MSNGSLNGHGPTNGNANISACPVARSYEEDRNATSKDVYVDLEFMSDLATMLYTDGLVLTPPRTVYPCLTLTRSRGRVSMVLSSYRTST